MCKSELIGYLEKFMKNVEKTNYCWLWRGCTDKRGYGLFHHNGLKIYAHRYSLIVHSETALPPEGIVRHICDNPLCVNPDHLLSGTHQDNVMDRVIRNRSAKGEKHGRSIFTRRMVRMIKKYPDIPISVFADIFRMKYETVKKIREGKNWQHIIQEPVYFKDLGR